MDVVVVNWNAGPLIRECVRSVIEHGNGLVGQLVVVDNDSTDGSDVFIEAMPNVTLIRPGQNLGFAKACNLGARRGNSEFVLFLNPDARLLPPTLERVVDFMQRPDNSRVGVCGVQLIDEEGSITRKCARFPSATAFLARAVGLDRLVPALQHCLVSWDHATTREVDQVMGAFFFVRRCVFDTLAGFDEQFFVYFEDLDFSYRAKRAGWSNVYFAGAQAFHLGAGTSRHVKANRLFYVLRGRILYVFKHFNPLAVTLVLLATIIVEPISRTALTVARRSETSVRETWRAYSMLVRWLVAWTSGLTKLHRA